MKLAKLAIFFLLIIAVFISVVFYISHHKHPQRVKRIIKKEQAKILENDKKYAHDKRVTRIILKSKLLKKNMGIDVYLPREYDKRKKYPVLYILPGGMGNEKYLIAGLGIDKTADKLIAHKIIKPLIIVSPEVDNSLGLNSSLNYVSEKIDGQWIQRGMYEDYISEELVRFIDYSYSTITSRHGRFISGISTGGYIALRIAFLHPDEYGKAGGYSPVLIQRFQDKRIENLFFPTKKAKEEGNVINLAAKNSLSTLKVYLDSENTDSLYLDCIKLYKILKSKGIKAELHINHGSHSNVYWKSKVEEYLLFYTGRT